MIEGIIIIVTVAPIELFFFNFKKKYRWNILEKFVEKTINGNDSTVGLS
jgi:hypothetical protein